VSLSPCNSLPLRSLVSPKVQMSDKVPLWKRAAGSWAIWSHLVLCLVTSGLMLFKLDGYYAANDSSSIRFKFRHGLSVSDVTTLTSVANTLIRICAASITTVNSARCILMLLEKTTLDLGEIQAIATWKAILWPVRYPRRSEGQVKTDNDNDNDDDDDDDDNNDEKKHEATNPARWVWGLGVLLLLTVPQQFSAPILSGAVDWNLSELWGEEVRTLSAVRGEVELDWSSYANDTRLREWFARRASGYASMTWGAANDTDRAAGMKGGTCRHMVDDKGLPAGSKLLNVTFPMVKIHSIVWDAQDSSTPLPSGPTVSSFGDDVFRYFQTGNAVLYHPTGAWKIPKVNRSCVDIPGRTAAYNASLTSGNVRNDGTKVLAAQNQVAVNPDASALSVRDTANSSSSSSGGGQNCTVSLPRPATPIMFDGVVRLAVLLSRQNATGCEPVRPNSFGNITSVKIGHIVSVKDDITKQESCYAIGSVNLTVGLASVAEARYISNRVVDGDCSGETLREGQWVQEALFMMPDVMTMVSLTNTTGMPTWNSLDGYARTLIKQSFTAAWDVLDSAAGGNVTEVLTARPYEPRIQASVSTLRIILWLMLNLVMLAAIGGVRIAENYCERKPVHDVTAALLMTPVHVESWLGKNDTGLGLGGLTVVTERVKGMRFRLVRSEGKDFHLKQI